MIYKCILKNNNDSDILVSVNGLDLLCFSNLGIYGDVDEEICLNIEVYDDYEIRASNENKKQIEYISGYQYKITGFLDIDKRGVDSLIFFELDNLYEYGFLDKKMVDLYILRLNISNIEQ